MLTVVIPAYNETENLRQTLPLLRQAIEGSGLVDDYEFIVVDDHSTEPMYEALAAMNDPRIHCLRLSRNSGSHVALRAGLAASRGDAVLCISADGQEDPAVIPEMLRKWRDGGQVIWGLRRQREKEGLVTQNLSLLFYKMLTVLAESRNDEVDLSRADFYLLDRQVVRAINGLPERNSSLFGLLVWIGFRQDTVEYNRRERLSGKSKWKFRARMRLAKDWIIAFSGLPLKIMTVFGFVVAALGLLYAGVIAYRAVVVGMPVQGWASLMIVVLVMGGFQMSMLGIIGEYLWRTLEETRRRSLYFVEKTTLDSSVAAPERHSGRQALKP